MKETSVFLNNYKDKLKSILDKLNLDDISKSISLLEESVENNSTIYIIGNGGSAATASHMENDLGFGLKQRGLINLNVKSLSDNTAVCTAIANDTGYENIFYMQLKDILKSQDILIAISCSGNSANIIKAAEYAKKIGTRVIGLTGFSGGKLKKICDINFHVDTTVGEYGLVEDTHMIYDHMVYSYFIEKGARSVR